MPFSIIAGDSVPTTEKGMYIIFYYNVAAYTHILDCANP